MAMVVNGKNIQMKDPTVNQVELFVTAGRIYPKGKISSNFARINS